MKKFFWLLCCCLMQLSNGARAQSAREFDLHWRTNLLSPINRSALLDAPAGKDGFAQIKNGHFVKGDGERLRIWGINFSSNACFPNKEDAPDVADYLARCGINGVRFHHMDNPGTHLLDGDPSNSRQLNSDKLDRLDYLIAELKKRGIYANLNLNVARRFKEGDGVRDAELLGYAKGITYFDERIIELQKEYAKQLLTHYNPYTKTKYCDEPAVAIVEIVNENSLVEAWIAGRLLGKNTQKNPGTWSDIPASYEKDLTQKYNAWLKKNVSESDLVKIAKEAKTKSGQVIPRLNPNEFAKASELRFHNEARFYMDTEAAFFEDFSDYLKNELNVKAAVIGSSDHNHYKSGYPHLTANNLLDAIDGHVYWQHPSYGEGRVDGRQAFTIKNTPMVNDPYFSTVVQLSRTAVAGKPYTVSETNHPYPSEYACEGIPILAAYALLQDWDGIFFYTFSHNPPDKWESRMRGHFDYRPDPMKMVSLAASAMTFLRGDVRAAEQTVERSYSRESVIESLRLTYKDAPYFTPGFSLAIPLMHATRVSSLKGETTVFKNPQKPSRIVSDTGELTWSIEKKDKGFVTIDAPKTQALIGFVRDNEPMTANLSAQVKNEFCSIQCISLDGKPISQSNRMLLVTTAKAANHDTKWNEKRTSLLDWGEAPMEAETVEGSITLYNLNSPKSVTITPLDGQGNPLSKPLAVKKTDDNTWTVSLGEPASLWRLIEVK